MRDILFRGKRKNGTWITGCPICVKIAGQECWLIFGKEFLFDGTNAKSLNHALVNPETIGEWTGLCDDNKQKIFEGDILHLKSTQEDFDFHAVVEFGNPNGYYTWGWQLRPIHGSAPNLDILLWVETELGMYGMSCEIVGNVHENKEMGHK